MVRHLANPAKAKLGTGVATKVWVRSSTVEHSVYFMLLPENRGRLAQ